MSVDSSLQKIDEELKIIMEEIGIEKFRQQALIEKLPLKKKMNMIHSILNDGARVKKISEYLEEIESGSSRVSIVALNSILPFGIDVFMKSDGVRIVEQRVKVAEGIEIEDIMEMVHKILEAKKEFRMFSDEFYNLLLFRNINLNVGYLEFIEFLCINFVEDFEKILLMGNGNFCCYKSTNFYRLIMQLFNLRRPPTKFLEFILNSKNKIFGFILSSLNFTSKFKKTESIRRIEVKLLENMIADGTHTNEDMVQNIVKNSILRFLKKEEIMFFLNSLENSILKNNQEILVCNINDKECKEEKTNKEENRTAKIIPMENPENKCETVIKKPILKKPILNKTATVKPILNKPALNKPGIGKKLPPTKIIKKLPPKSNSIKLFPDKEFINIRWNKIQKNDSLFNNINFEGLEEIYTIEDLEPFTKIKKPPTINKPVQKIQSIFDDKKANAIEIALGRIKIENKELIRKITSLEEESINENLIKQIIYNMPSKEEEEKIKTENIEKLKKGEEFYRRALEIENFTTYLDFLYFVKNYKNIPCIKDNLKNYLKFYTTVRQSKEFIKYIAHTLYIGNIMNGKSFLGNAEGYNLICINIFRDIIGRDGKSAMELALKNVDKNKIIEDFRNIENIVGMDYRSLFSEYEEIKRLYNKIKDTKINIIEEKIKEYTVEIEELSAMAEEIDKESQLFAVFCGTEVNEALLAELYKFIVFLKN